MIGALTFGRLRARLLSGGNVDDTGAQQRARGIALSSLSALVAKALSVAVMLVTVPLTLHYLGPERYGMWLIMSSFIGMLAFADLGIGNGILNAVAAAHGRNDPIALGHAVSGGFAALVGISALLSAAFGVFWPQIAWHRLFNVTGQSAVAEAAPAMAVFATCFLLAIPLGLIQRVQIGLQRGFIANLWQGAGSIAALCSVLVAISLQAGLPWLVLAFMGGPLAASLANSIWTVVQSPQLCPHWRSIRRDSMRATFSDGAGFLCLQIATSMTYSSPALFIAHYLGPSAVAQYALPERIFALTLIVVSLSLGPFWPAYRNAIVRRDFDWIAHTHKTTSRIVYLASAIALVILTLVIKVLIGLWVGRQLVISDAMPVLLAILNFVTVSTWINGMLLNAVNDLKFQSIVSTAMAIAALGLMAFLTPLLGIIAAPLSVIISSSLFLAIPYHFRARVHLRRFARHSGAE